MNDTVNKINYDWVLLLEIERKNRFSPPKYEWKKIKNNTNCCGPHFSRANA